MSSLKIDDISMRFELPNGGAVQALQNVSLNLKKGELMSVLGPSGCGKTTLLNIVAGFLAPTGGKVILNDHVVTGPAAERGMVFQQGALFEWMNVRKNIAFGPDMAGKPKAETEAKVNSLLEDCWPEGFCRQDDLRIVRRHAATRGTCPLSGQ